MRDNLETPNRTANESSSFTLGTQMVLENAVREATQLGRDSVGTEFLLIGLIREIGAEQVLRGSLANEEGAALVLQKLGVDLGSLRTKVLALMVASD